MYDLIVLGAGAAGLMAAARLPGKKVLVLEHNPGPAAKIAISGGGRCNLTNQTLSPDDYLGERAFVEAVLRRFDNDALLAWLRKRGLTPVLRKKSRWFCPESAKELVDVLLDACAHADFAYDTEILGVRKEGDRFFVETSRGKFSAPKVLVATGGLSYPKIGASGIGFAVAEGFGHTLVPPRPALVGLTLQPAEAWMKALAGLSLPVAIRVGRREIEGDLLFAHKGLSGPAVLDASLWWNRGKLTVDFLPDARLARLFKNPKKSAMSQIPLPRRFVRAFFDALKLPNVPYHAMDEVQKQRLSLLKSYAFAPAGTFGYAKAEATKGGVAVDAIDPKRMESRLVPGLHFAGEVLDVTGRVGGYNFQWAFSSAVVAAEAICNEK